jgi:chromatin assembly factor 1 subunit A
MSANVPDLESVTRKRTLDDFLGAAVKQPYGDGTAMPTNPTMGGTAAEASSNHGTAPQRKRGKVNEKYANEVIAENAFNRPIPSLPPPENSSPSSLTEAGSSTPGRPSVSPNITPSRAPLTQSNLSSRNEPQSPDTTASLSPPPSELADPSESALDTAPPNTMPMVSNAPPLALPTASVKRKRLNAEEKAERDRLEAERKQEKAEARAVKAAEKAKEEAEKKARQAERAQERANKAAEEAAKKAAKAEKKDAKEAVRQEKVEEAQKRERSQLKLNSFFKIGPAASPAKAKLDAQDAEPVVMNGSPLKAKASADNVSEYDKLFRPFFQRENVTMARSCPDMDDEALKYYSEQLEAVINQTEPVELKPFDATEYFELPFGPIRRGRVPRSVNAIMAEFDGSTKRKAIDLTTEAENTQIRKTREELRTVKMRYLRFYEDVRPAYFGTVTSKAPSSAGLRVLARRPINKSILPLDYDYDSEAEWQDDDGEDVDMEDEEEDLEPDEDMGDFLDDSEDPALLRPAFVKEMVPETVGPCWEDRKRLGSDAHMYKYRMEFILGKSTYDGIQSIHANWYAESLEHHHGVDPFSTSYWEPKVQEKPAVAKLTTDAAGAPAMAPPPAPADAFQALAAPPDAPKKGRKSQPPYLTPELTQLLKETVLKNPALTKGGTVDLFYSLHSKGCTRGQIHTSLADIAEKSGRFWKLKEPIPT